MAFIFANGLKKTHNKRIFPDTQKLYYIQIPASINDYDRVFVCVQERGPARSLTCCL